MLRKRFPALIVHYNRTIHSSTAQTGNKTSSTHDYGRAFGLLGKKGSEAIIAKDGSDPHRKPVTEASAAYSPKAGEEPGKTIASMENRAIISQYGPDAHSSISKPGAQGHLGSVSRKVAAKDARRERLRIEEYERNKIINWHPEWSDKQVERAVRVVCNRKLSV